MQAERLFAACAEKKNNRNAPQGQVIFGKRVLAGRTDGNCNHGVAVVLVARPPSKKSSNLAPVSVYNYV